MLWKDFQRPKSIEVDAETLSPTYGRFEAQPFERGFATTVGNAMRRCLLSSIEGAAITAVKIEGVLHEFSSIPGVVEDVIDLLLNLKQIPLKLHGDEPRIVSLEASDAGVVTAGDLVADPQVEIVDPDRLIATLNEEGSLNLQAQVRQGRGYVGADRNFDESLGVGWIPIDSVHSPVKRVNFKVESARLGRTTDYERLVLEVWTNGTTEPEDAVAMSAALLREHLAIFVEAEAEVLPVARLEEEPSGLEALLEHSIDELEISSRAANTLKNADIFTLRDLVTRSEDEILATKNFGQKSFDEVQDVLAGLGLRVGMELDEASVDEIGEGA